MSSALWTPPPRPGLQPGLRSAVKASALLSFKSSNFSLKFFIKNLSNFIEKLKFLRGKKMLNREIFKLKIRKKIQ